MVIDIPLISFSGTTSMGPFWKQILAGQKTQTCRKPRKRPIKQGDILYLYWRVRVPKKKKPIHYIGQAKCVDVKRMKYSEFAFDAAFARRDGFRDHLELQSWFGDPSDWCDERDPPYRSDEKYDVISWKLMYSLTKPGVQANCGIWESISGTVALSQSAILKHLNNMAKK